MNTMIHTWILGPVLLLCAGAARAAQTAEAHQLASGSAAAMQQNHPILSVVLHLIAIAIIVSAAGVVFSTITNPSSRR